MQKWRQSMFANPATWYGLAGIGLLATSLWVPWATAARTARIERRADDIATLLLEASLPFVDDLDEASTSAVLARFHRLASRDGLIVSDVEVVDPLPGTLLSLRNKHYVFHFAEAPLPEGRTKERGAVSPREVMAWPIDENGPGHCAFFHPDDGPRAFTRNLTAKYTGLDSRRPLAGSAHPTSQHFSDVTTFYRSADDERWILY